MASPSCLGWAWLVMGLFLTPVHAQINAQPTTNQPLFPAFFIFGDSLVDVGNNNYIYTLARSNFKPYGIDFGGPTGRFCNGKTSVDVLSELLNLPLIPPYLAPTTRGQAILHGVNYASAAGGILQKTGFNYIGRVDFDTQLEWFENTISELQQMLGVSATQDLVKGSLFSIIFGSNDFINNYLLRVSSTSKEYTPQQYQQILLSKYYSQLVQLYNMGARNILLPNVGPLGCIPAQLIAQKSVNGECSSYVNNLVINFNLGLQNIVQQLNANCPGSKFVYADFYGPVLAYYNNPQAYGFQFSSQACCGDGKFGAQRPCTPISSVCLDRSKYLFWDSFHPTEAANNLVIGTLFHKLRNAFS